MLKDIFVHACILITFLFIGGSVFRHYPNFTTVFQKLLFGTFSGVLGSLLMFFTIHLTPTVIMDYRHIAILLSALYGGGISALATVIIICVCRIFFVTSTMKALVVSVILMFLIGIAATIIVHLHLSELKKWIFMYVTSLFLMSFGFFYLIGMTPGVIVLLGEYWVISLLSGALIFYCANYIVQSNRTFYDVTKQSRTDFLTGLNNLRQFESILNASIKRAEEENEKLSFLMIDIDHFKKVNDQYGHQSGDAVLRQMASLLLMCSRSFDIVSRMGGEEFSVLLSNCNNQQAIQISERIRSVVEKTKFFLPDGKFISLTVSVGVATYLETTLVSHQLMKQADTALYKAKNGGRNKVWSIATC